MTSQSDGGAAAAIQCNKPSVRDPGLRRSAGQGSGFARNDGGWAGRLLCFA